MQIYTSYFGQLKNLQKYNIIPIAISRFIPDFYKGLRYIDLSPTVDILNNYKNSHSEYIKRFNQEVISSLNPLIIYQNIVKLSNNKDCALLCYETPNKFCHRHLIAEWLNNSISNINITEFNPNNIGNINPLF